MYEAKGLVSWRSGQYSGPAVDRAGIRGRNVLLSIFVFVFQAEVGVFDDFDWFQGPRGFGNRNRAADTLQVLLQTPFLPVFMLVVPDEHYEFDDWYGRSLPHDLRSVSRADDTLQV